MNSPSSLPKTLENLALIRFSGKDTLDFLQGQLSNDINALDKTWQFSGYCNPKGRLLALMQIWVGVDNAVYALLDRSLSQIVIKRLRMYVMRSNVVIEELHDARCLGRIDTSLPGARFSLETSDTIHQLNYGGQQLLIELDPVNSSSNLDHACSIDQWHGANIIQGLPEITLDTFEMFVPQMINLDLIGGISFKKGCYTGQEIVARMHYLGKLKQRMFLCKLGSDAQAGDKVLANDNNGSSKSAGNVVRVSLSQKLALAVLRVEMVEAEMTFLLENGDELTVHDNQPYELALNTN